MRRLVGELLASRGVEAAHEKLEVEAIAGYLVTCWETIGHSVEQSRTVSAAPNADSKSAADSSVSRDDEEGRSIDDKSVPLLSTPDGRGIARARSPKAALPSSFVLACSSIFCCCGGSYRASNFLYLVAFYFWRSCLQNARDLQGQPFYFVSFHLLMPCVLRL